MPGKMLQSLTKVGTSNPLFLLDEIDKLGMDFRGDPSSALLEVLDPEQNHTFSDHYVEVDFDLSDVMFIATSNSMNIPPALLDRMEVIRLSGYTEDEKVNIAHALPAAEADEEQRREGRRDRASPKSAIRDIIRYYTREAGVRSLEREISKICRKVVKALQLKKVSEQGRRHRRRTSTTTSACASYDYGRAEKKNQVGQVVGLAWTEVGGDLLTIEAAVMPGKGNIIRTGTLGDVMKESIEAARSVVRSRARRLGIKDEMFEKSDIHIHVPEGATPKDGPSAGIAMTTALVSALTGIPVRADVAMTGEITLRGEVTADRRPEGKAAGGASRRHQDRADSGRERQGPAGDSGQRQEQARDRAGALDRPGAGNRARERCRSRCPTKKPAKPAEPVRGAGPPVPGC